MSRPSPEQVAALLSKYKAIAVRCARERDEARCQLVKALSSLDELVNAKAISGVRKTVSGWLGEGRSDGPYEHRHPANLGARIETRCGAMYELDDIMQRVRVFLDESRSAS